MIRNAHDTAVVCRLVADCPRPVAGSTRRPCGDCGRPVWLSPATARAAGAGALIVCPGCLPARLAAEGRPVEVAKLTPEQVREVAEGLARDNPTTRRRQPPACPENPT